MNAKDIIKYGNLHLLEAIKNTNSEEWEKIRVTTLWSLKDVISHLVSFEKLLEDALNFVLKPGTLTPMLDKINSDKAGFNDREVEERKGFSAEEVMKEYTETQKRVTEIIKTTNPETLSKVGTIPWYGNEYSLDDFIVYASYGHKQEHIGQIKKALKDRNKNP